MNKDNKIKNLKGAIHKIVESPLREWVHGISKSKKLKKLRLKINSLRKKYKKHG